MRHDHEDDAQDGWLALTCEVEREAPGLLDALGVRTSADAEGRLDAIVREGDEASFLAWLRETRALLEAATPGSDDAARLIAVLAEVYLLLPGFRAPEPAELEELRRLRALAA